MTTAKSAIRWRRGCEFGPARVYLRITHT